MAIAELLAQALFEVPAAGIAWALQRTTRMSQQTAELVANFVIVGIIAGACLIAWSIYQST
jgi:ABC-type cobalamin transport system permease subunit